MPGIVWPQGAREALEDMLPLDLELEEGDSTDLSQEQGTLASSAPETTAQPISSLTCMGNATVNAPSLSLTVTVVGTPLICISEGASRLLENDPEGPQLPAASVTGRFEFLPIASDLPEAPWDRKRVRFLGGF